MAHKPVIYVMDSTPLYAHDSFWESVHVLNWDIHHSDSPQEGFKELETSYDGFKCDHSALVAQRLFGNTIDGKTIGTAPKEATVCCVCKQNRFEKIDLTQSPFEIEKERLLRDLKQIDALQKIAAQEGDLKGDVISLSDDMLKLFDVHKTKLSVVKNYADAMLMPCLLWRSQKNDMPQELKEALSLYATQIKALADLSVIDQIKHPDMQATLTRMEEKYNRYFEKEGDELGLKELFHQNYQNISFHQTGGLKAFLKEYCHKAFHCLRLDENGEIKALSENKSGMENLKKQLDVYYQKYEHVLKDLKEKNIAFFNVDLLDKTELHGVDGQNKVAKQSLDSRRPKKLSAWETILFPNQGITAPKAWSGKDKWAANNPNAHGGISSLVPALAGLFASARSVDKNITQEQFIFAVKKTGSFEAGDGLFGGYLPNVQKMKKYVQEKASLPNKEEAYKTDMAQFKKKEALQKKAFQFHQNAKQEQNPSKKSTAPLLGAGVSNGR